MAARPPRPPRTPRRGRLPRYGSPVASGWVSWCRGTDGGLLTTRGSPAAVLVGPYTTISEVYALLVSHLSRNPPRAELCASSTMRSVLLARVRHTVVVGIARILGATASGAATSSRWGFGRSIALARPRGRLVDRLRWRLRLAVGVEFWVVACGVRKVTSHESVNVSSTYRATRTGSGKVLASQPIQLITRKNAFRNGSRSWSGRCDVRGAYLGSD